MEEERVSERRLDNMGNMSKEAAEGFAAYVFQGENLQDEWKMEWCKGGPSICLNGTIHIRDKVLRHCYPWQIKEEILHEIAHIRAPKDFHWVEFYREYVRLLQKYMVDEPFEGK